MTSPAPIVFEDVSLQVEDRWFFRNVDLTVRPGESLIVAGLPGSGKSFILRLILGLPGTGLHESIRVTGRILAGGESVLEMTSADLNRWRSQVGYVMRDGGLIENMDIRGNVELPLNYHCRDVLSQAQVEARCDELMSNLGIRDLGVPGQRPVTLNREQRIYVSLARALIAGPDLLLMDAPTAGLSPSSAQRLKAHCYGRQRRLDGAEPDRDTMTRITTTNDLGRYLDCGSRFAVLDSVGVRIIGDREAVEASTDARVKELLACGTPPGGDWGAHESPPRVEETTY